jgi:hypothetical protein
MQMASSETRSENLYVSQQTSTGTSGEHQMMQVSRNFKKKSEEEEG